ncbi:hypothetical protein NPIL_406101, partial [Nephila pilipes]
MSMVNSPLAVVKRLNWLARIPEILPTAMKHPKLAGLNSIDYTGFFFGDDGTRRVLPLGPTVR